jgi:hypothetical protein
MKKTYALLEKIEKHNPELFEIIEKIIQEFAKTSLKGTDSTEDGEEHPVDPPPHS